jgi:NAD(P)-dependent dehydrogenase (short-subunit alcohol dehydrogenase family)
MSIKPGWTYAAAALASAMAIRSLVRRWRALDLEHKVVAITGGSRGLGLILARQLMDRGAKVAICARDPLEIARAREDLGGEANKRLLAITCDITDRLQVDRFVAEVRAALGPVDVVINNAGVIEVGPMEHMTPEDYERAMATHFWGPLYLTLAVLPEMRARHKGRIVNITSIGGKIAVPHLLPYTASKFALVGLSEGMRAELASEGIAITTVVPGLMRTGSAINAEFKGQHRAEYAWFAVGASLPVTSMRAERAARRIIEAMRRGEPEVVLSIQAKLAVKLYALAPGFAQRVTALVARLLPEPGGIETLSRPGHDSQSAVTRSVLTRSTERAALRNNEV